MVEVGSLPARQQRHKHTHKRTSQLSEVRLPRLPNIEQVAVAFRKAEKLAIRKACRDMQPWLEGNHS